MGNPKKSAPKKRKAKRRSSGKEGTPSPESGNAEYDEAREVVAQTRLYAKDLDKVSKVLADKVDWLCSFVERKLGVGGGKP